MRKLLAVLFSVALASSAFADGIQNPGGGSGSPTGAAGGSLAGTYPNPTLAMDTAWTTFTPSFTCGTGTFTVTSARFKTEGKTTWISIDFTVATLGTCNNAIAFTLPNTAQSGASIGITDIAITGACQILPASATSTCAKSTAAAFVAAERYTGSGVYENQ